MVDTATAEKKLSRLKSLAKSQQKLRGKRQQIIKGIALKYSEVGSKFKKLGIKQKDGRPNFESKLEGLHEAILFTVVPDLFTDESRMSQVDNSVRSLDHLHKALQGKGFVLSRTATYYPLLPANACIVPVKLLRPHNILEKNILTVTSLWHL